MYFYILIIKLIFIVDYYFVIKKTVIKYSFLKVNLNLDKAHTSVIFSFTKSSIKFITFLLVYFNFFIFNTIMKNKKTMSEYYKKKIVISLLKTIYLLTLNIYKAMITSLKLDL